MPHDFDNDAIIKYPAPYLGDIIDKDLDFKLSPNGKICCRIKKI